MSELFRTILLRVTISGLVAAAALSVVRDGAMREIVRLAAGLLMLLALLQPLGGGLRRAAVEQTVPDRAQIERQNTQTAMSAIGSSIANSLAKRAAALGLSCTFSVEMETDADGILQIARVTVYAGEDDRARLPEVQQMIADECGVPTDRQEVIER